MKATLFFLLTLKSVLISSDDLVKFLGFTPTPIRSKPMNVTVYRASGEEIQFHSWQVVDTKNLEVQQKSKDKFLFIDGYTYPSDRVFDTEYELTFTHQFKSLGFLVFSDIKKETFRFVPSPMILKIKRGYKRNHNLKYDLILDGTLSKDPSYPPNENGMSGNKVEWSVSPPLLKRVPMDKLHITIPKKALEEKNYTFTLKVTRDKIAGNKDVQTIQQVVTVMSSKKRNISIKCHRNCEYPNPGQVTVLSVDCQGPCRNRFLYKWKLHPRTSRDNIMFGSGYGKIIIKENTYQPGTRVTVVVTTPQGTLSYDIPFVEKFIVGKCFIRPKSGISGITLFRVFCSGFISKYGFLMYMIYQRYDKENLGVLLNADAIPHKRNMYLAVGSPATVVVKVLDNAYMYEHVELNVRVKSYPNHDITHLIGFLLAENRESIRNYAKLQRRNRVVQMVSLFLDIIDEIDDLDEQIIKDVDKHLAWNIFNVKPNNFYDAIQVLSIVKKFLLYKFPDDTYTTRILGRSVKEAVIALYFATAYEELVSTPLTDVKEFVVDFINISSDMLARVENVETFLKTTTPIEIYDYDLYDEMNSAKLKVRDDLRELTENIVLAYDVVSRSLMHDVLENENAVTFNMSIGLTARRVSLPLKELNLISIPMTSSSAIFSQDLSTELEQESHYIDYFFLGFTENPFWWHRNKSKLNSDVVHFSVFKGCRNISTKGENVGAIGEYSVFNYIDSCSEIKKVKSLFYISIHMNVIPCGYLTGTTTENNFDNIAAHRVELHYGFELYITFKEPTATYRVTYSLCYCSKDDFSRGIEIIPGSNNFSRTLKVNQTLGKNFVYVCIEHPGFDMKYEGIFSVMACVSWNKEYGTWTSEGCEILIGMLRNESKMICACNHFSFFTVQTFVPFSQLNYNTEIDFTIAIEENWIILLFISLLWALWIALFVWAWNKDKKFHKINMVHKLDDNVPGDANGYLMVVFTGVFIDAKTTADVAFQLIGNKSRSRIHLIKCSGVRLLQRDTQDWFLVFTPRDLGDIKVLRIWHNCKGKYPHWYCERVLVQCLKTGTQFCFIVNKWFSLIWGKGKIYHEITVTEEIILQSPELLFTTQLRAKFKNGHLWMSVFARDPQSNFNSKERVSTAISMLFLSVLANAFFFGIPLRQPADSIDPHLSYLNTAKQIVISIESLLASLPLGFIIVLIFKSSEPRRLDIKRKIKKTNKIDDKT